MSSDPAELEGLIDVARLEEWLGDRIPGAGEPLAVKRISAGAINELFELRRGEHVSVLRRPPKNPHSAEASNRIMLREFRLLSALEGTGVPHPMPFVACEDPEVIGACFYLMERIDGFVPKDPLPPPFDADAEARRGLGLELIDTLAELANVDWRAAGLEGFGKPEGFMERQVERWLGQLATYKMREIPGIDAVAAWLTDRRPEMSAPGIMHGDYQFINVMFHHGAPARMAAAVDWEQATIGDPLLDLGWVVGGWSDPGEEPPLRFASSYFSQREGLPTRDDLVERYARRTGRDVSSLEYYVVLAWFKLACVLEGSYARFVSGKSRNPMHERMGEIVLRLMRDAERLVTAAR